MKSNSEKNHARTRSPSPATDPHAVPSVPKIPRPTRLTAANARRIILNTGYPISRSTLYRMLQDGRLAHERVGNKILITLEELERFLDRCQNAERY